MVFHKILCAIVLQTMTRIPREPQHINADFVCSRPPRKPRAMSSARTFETAMRNAQQFLAAVKDGSVDYTQVVPLTVVGLFILMHTWVYEVEPIELRDRKVMMFASSAVRRLIADFGGDIRETMEFVRWTWAREKKSFAKRETDFRIGWRYQFCSKALITDYRIVVTKAARIAT